MRQIVRGGILAIAAALMAACGGGGQALTYTIGGTVGGLNGTLVLQDNGADDLSIMANGQLTFATALSSGAPYAVTVRIQPVGQTCSVGNASGTVAAAPVGNVSVTCVTLASGVLDTSFGAAGKFMMPPGEARGAVLQPDGKLVIVATGPFTNHHSFTLERFNADGGPDLAFGTAGKSEGNLGGLSVFGESPMALAIQGDGKLVVAGWGTTMAAGQPTMQFALARYDANGALDPTFGTGGLAFAAFGHRSSLLWSLLIQPDGKLVAVGGTSDGTQFDFAVSRFLTNGAPDPSFGTNGMVITDIQSNRSDDTAQGVALQPDGKLVVAGWSQVSNNVFTATARYNTDGSLDASFAGAGRQYNPAADFGSGRVAVALQSDGKILINSTPTTNAEDFGLSRYNPDGSVDTAYGTNGMVTTDFNNGTQERAMTVVLQADGKAIVGGFSSLGLSGPVFALARYGTDGRLDTGFGSSGKVVTDFGVSLALVDVLLIQPDGKIVAVGGASNGTWSAAVARYTP